MPPKFQNSKKRPLSPKDLNRFSDGFEIERWEGNFCLILSYDGSSYWWVNCISVTKEAIEKHKNYRRPSLKYE